MISSAHCAKRRREVSWRVYGDIFGWNVSAPALHTPNNGWIFASMYGGMDFDLFDNILMFVWKYKPIGIKMLARCEQYWFGWGCQWGSESTDSGGNAGFRQ